LPFFTNDRTGPSGVGSVILILHVSNEKQKGGLAASSGQARPRGTSHSAAGWATTEKIAARVDEHKVLIGIKIHRPAHYTAQIGVLAGGMIPIARRAVH